jgi:hypothetical protein
MFSLVVPWPDVCFLDVIFSSFTEQGKSSTTSHFASSVTTSNTGQCVIQVSMKIYT